MNAAANTTGNHDRGREDGELVRQTQAGDWNAFACLAERYRNMVCGVAYHYLHSAEDAQDIAQETFVVALLRLGDLRDPTRFAPWLRRATLNLCADRLRSRHFRQISLDGLTETAGDTIFTETGFASTGLGRAASGNAEALDTRLFVWEALARLSDKARLVLTLHYMGGYSHDEIARFLDVPLNTVRSRLQAAKRQMRQELTCEEITMVNDVLQPPTPDPDWARQIVEEAMRRGEAALEAYRKGEAVSQYAAALDALGKWQPGPDRQRLEMKALWQKGKATDPYRSGYAEAIPLFESALALARELGDRESEANYLQNLAQVYFNTNLSKYAPRATEYAEKARAIFAELGNAHREGESHRFLGDMHLPESLTQGKRDYEEALRLFEAANALPDAVQCRAFLDLLAEVGEERFAHLVGRFIGVDGLKAQNGWISHTIENCNISFFVPDGQENIPMLIQRVFWQIGNLHPFLDVSIQAGGSWSKPAASYTEQPLTVTATVLTDSESVTVPAGTFTGCRLIEYVTTESETPDNAPEDKKAGNREEFCGTRRAWYAPQVGIVQLCVRRADGQSATLQLEEYAISSGENGWLPLAIGNTWAYGWKDTPQGWTAREKYKVAAQTTAPDADTWLLEHYAYTYPETI